MKEPPIYIDSFDTFGPVMRKTTYEDVKAAVLAADRFSVFEASASARAARMYDRLSRDPEIEVVTMEYPWFSVRWVNNEETA